MFQRLSVIYVLFLISCQVFSQENSPYFLEVLNSKEYTKETKETILDSLFSDLNYNNFYDIHEYSKWFWKNKNLDKAIFINKQTIKKKELYEYDNKEIRKKIIKNIGFFYYLKKEYYQSLYYYHQATLIKEFEEVSANCYRKMGQIFFNLGDYYNAEKYYDRALSISIATNLNLYVGTSINASINLKKLKTKEKFNKGKSILESAIKVIDTSKTKFPNKRILNAYKQLGNLYTENLSLDTISNFKNSFKNYKISLKIAEKINDSSHTSEILNNIGYLHLLANNSNSINYLEEGLTFSKNNLHTSRVYSNISSYFKQKGQYNLSLENINKAINVLVDKKESEISGKLDRESLKTNKHKFYLFNKLIDKGVVLNKLNNYHEAIETFKICDYLLDLVRHESKSKDSKLFWQEKASLLFNEATKASYFINDRVSALYFIEKNKAILLLENITKQKYNLNDEINFEDFKDMKMSDYKPKDFSNESKITTLNDIQKSLAPNTMLLNYIINNKFGYLVSITKEETKLHEICDLDNLKQDIKSYLQLISKPITSREELLTLETLSINISKTIIPFDIDTKKINRLLIIPDYNLQNIPFESLTHNNGFLIKDFEISYAYSYSYLIKNNEIDRNPKKHLISFAPYSFNYDNLKTLHQSLNESKSISETMDGQHFEKDLATLNNFKEHIYDYNIINIASHANANDSIAPWIAFKDQKLYLDEIYETKNQAEMVVLSACQTSLGDIKKGEGVFSLARGFFRSGSKSIVASLWNVNDKSNAEITIRFYKYLKQGKTKSAALRQAKLDYLNTHSLSEISPYYWSSLVLIGDASIVEFNSSNWKYYILIFLMMFMLFSLIRKKINF